MASLRRRTVLAMAISAIGFSGAAKAQAGPDLVDLQVVDRETGQALRVWPHDRRLFVAGQPGARYSLRVVNHSGGRVLVVLSVDGVNIISGETAGYGQTGYVLSPYQSYDLSGWRKSDTEVAAFVFAPLPQSYAARTGRPGDVGVIGIAAFKERVAAPLPVQPAEARSDGRNRSNSEVSEMVVTGQRIPSPVVAPAPPSRSGAPATDPSDIVVTAERRAEKLGTGHGAREWSVTYNVPFERATPYPQLIRRIEYDTYDNLVASGVIRPARDWGHRPRPFPSNSDGAGYAPDPPGRP
ncbi:hypothetical protein [Phenylobacterium sp.]|uniref:hypothetical protein n=1 Tax=Phenylobacterium sp. TaxID=1871053 RepID=UPI00356557A3